MSAAVSCVPKPKASQCAPGLYPFKGDTCLDKVTQNFVSCTDTRGNDLSTQDRKRFEASVDAAAKGVGVGGVVELTRTVVETELPEVALRIVQYCLDLSRKVAEDDTLRTSIDGELTRLELLLEATSQGTVELEPASGPYTQTITVSGTHWPAGIEMQVSAATTQVRTVTGDDGTFSTTITLDPRFEDVAPSSIEVRAAPVKASPRLPATALYEIVR